MASTEQSGAARPFRVKVISLNGNALTGPLDPVVKEITVESGDDGVLEISFDRSLPVCGIELIERR